MDNKTDDKYWITLCQSGDEHAYSVLYKRYAQPTYNAIFRLVRIESEAEDLLQETFVIIFSEMDKLAGVEHLGAWIRRIAVNCSISYLRRRKIHFEELVTEEWAEKNMEKLSPHEEDEGQLLDCRIVDLERTIKELPEVYRTIVDLHAFEGMPHKEIGQRLGLSGGAVRSQYHRAKKMIFKQLMRFPYET